MLRLVGITLFTIFMLLAFVHAYWGAGGNWGASVAVPSSATGKKVFTPRPSACFIIAAGLLGCGLFVLVQSGWVTVQLPHWLNRYGTGVLTIIFLLRAVGDFRYVGFFKKITATPFARLDTLYYSPLCLIMAALLLSLWSLK